MLQFLENCVVELYGLDMAATYQHAFVYIRQLAVHLRQAHAKIKAKQAHDQVYNWQTVHSVKVWARVLAQYAGVEQLQLLHYPLVQVLHGIIALVPTPRHFPLRLQCTRMLHMLAAATATPNKTPLFVNSAAFLLEVLQYGAFFKKPSAYSGKPPLIAHMLRAPDKLLGSRAYLVRHVDDMRRCVRATMLTAATLEHDLH